MDRGPVRIKKGISVMSKSYFSKLHMMVLVSALLTGLLGPTMVYSQTTYRSTSGHVVATGLQNSQRVFAESHQSLVSLNYETMSVAIRIDLKTLDTGIDSLNGLLRSGSGKLASFEGKSSINGVNPSDHPQRSFDFTGNLTLNSVTKPMVFKATLTHLESSDNKVCLLSASGAISLRDFNLQLSGFSNDINVEIVRVALRKLPK